jgi:hypothetical protein
VFTARYGLISIIQQIKFSVLYGYQKRDRILLYTALTGWFITVVESVYCAEWTDSLYTTDKILCFDGYQYSERIVLFTALIGLFL